MAASGPAPQEDHPGPLSALPSRHTFIATHFTAGNSSFSQQLLYGYSDTLSAPPARSDRPESTVLFDMFRRNVTVEIYCDRCEPWRRDYGESKCAMWPFRATIPWEDLHSRGMRLDLADGLTDGRPGEIHNLRINLRRPPMLYYTYPETQAQRQRAWQGQPRRVYDRRATEEDYIAIPAGARWGEERNADGSEGDGKKMTVLGLPTSIAFFKPGNWLSYQFSLLLQSHEATSLQQILSDLRLTSSNANIYDQMSLDIPDSIPLPPNPQSLLSSIVRYPFPLRYLLEGLLSYGVVAPEDLTILIGQLSSVHDESLEKRERVLASLFSMGKISGRVQQAIDEVRQKLYESGPAKPLRAHVVMVRRAIVTPTRLLLRPPSEETSNHVLREHIDKIDRLLRVQFTDENDSIHYKAMWDDTKRGGYSSGNRGGVKWCPGRGMVGRMRRVMDEGLKFAGRNWTYLAAGGSQLKERQAWFICEDPESGFTAQRLRDWMGDFTKEKSIAKHCARISQSFSTTREVKGKLSITREPDIKNEKFLFTDGVGRVSQALTSKAATVLLGEKALFSKYSAVQVRIGGAKGMLATWPQTKGNQVVLRDSMLKYESKHQKFGAVMMAGYAPAHLNRQAILLMDALGTNRDALLAAFSKQLAEVEGLQERAASDKKLLEFDTTSFPIQKLYAAGLQSEAFVKDTVALLQTISLWDLKWKARIKVDKGVYLFGVADELGVLGEDEVFCSYADPFDLDNKGVVEGDCIITRAPSLHLGDVRKVKAVAHPKLIEAGLVNVVIFPTKGARDLANQLAGGDLDGDMFTLVWDPDLLIASNESPSDYTAPTLPRTVDKVELRHIKEWFIDYFKSDVLGQISTAHMAIADQKGPRCAECIKLAHLASDAVDFQKTGVAVQMSRELKEAARRRPDFMGGAWLPENTYESQGILGQMFRMVEKEPSFEPHTMFTIHPVLGALKVPMEFLTNAWRLKTEYELDLVGFMRQYMLSEIEVVTGLVAGIAVAPDRRKNMMKDDALKLSIKDAFQVKLVEVYLKQASDWAEQQEYPPEFHSATECFAVAAYQLVHDANIREQVQLEEEELTVLGDEIGQSRAFNADGTPVDELFSFCWLWADELADALFRRAGHPVPGQAPRPKRKRGDSPQEEGEEIEAPQDVDDDTLLAFKPIPERWCKKQKKVKHREPEWTNIEDDDDEVDAEAADQREFPTGPRHLSVESEASGVDHKAWANAVGDDDEADEEIYTVDSPPIAGPSGNVGNPLEIYSDDEMEMDENNDAPGRADEEDSDAGSPTAFDKSAHRIPSSLNRAEIPKNQISPPDSPSPVAGPSRQGRRSSTPANDQEEPYLPASPGSPIEIMSDSDDDNDGDVRHDGDGDDASSSSVSPAPAPVRVGEVIQLDDSDEEMYGEQADNLDVVKAWVNDDGSDDEERAEGGEKATGGGVGEQ